MNMAGRLIAGLKRFDTGQKPKKEEKMRIPEKSLPIVSYGSSGAQAPEEGIYPSAGTCDCNWFAFNCSVKTDNCGPGYYAKCNYGMYSCGCECRPG